MHLCSSELGEDLLSTLPFFDDSNRRGKGRLRMRFKLNHHLLWLYLWGQREEKYHILSNNNTATTRWTAVTPRSPFYLFTPQSTDLKAEYERGWKITDIYPIHSSCMNTLHDGFAISFDKTSLEAMLRDAADKSISDYIFREKYQVVDSRDWKLSKLRGGLTKAGAYELMGKIRACLYRPFDRRWIVLDDAVVGYARWETTKHFLSAKSLGLVTTRQTLQTIACLPSIKSLTHITDLMSFLSTSTLIPLRKGCLTPSRQPPLRLIVARTSHKRLSRTSQAK